MRTEKIPETQAEAFGLVLERWRTTEGLSQAEVAELVGLAQSSLSKIERGRSSPTLGHWLGLQVFPALVAAAQALCKKHGIV